MAGPRSLPSTDAPLAAGRPDAAPHPPPNRGRAGGGVGTVERPAAPGEPPRAAGQFPDCAGLLCPNLGLAPDGADGAIAGCRTGAPGHRLPGRGGSHPAARRRLHTAPAKADRARPQGDPHVGLRTHPRAAGVGGWRRPGGGCAGPPPNPARMPITPPRRGAVSRPGPGSRPDRCGRPRPSSASPCGDWTASVPRAARGNPSRAW